MAKSRVRVETPQKQGEFKLWLTNGSGCDYVAHKEEPELEDGYFSSAHETELCSEAAELLTGNDLPEDNEVYEITLQRVSVRKGRAGGIKYDE